MEKNSGTSASFLFLEPQASKPQLGSLIGTLRLLSCVHAASLLFFSSAFYLFIIIYAALLFATRFPVNTSPCSVFTECCLSSLSSSFCFHHHLPFLPSLSFFSSSLCCHYPAPLTCSLIIKNLVSCPLFLFYSLVYISNVLSIFPSILLFSFSPPLSISTFPSLFAFLLVISPFFPSLLLLSQSLLFSSILFCFLFCV